MKSMDRSTHSQILIEGILNERWLHWFEGLEVKSSADDFIEKGTDILKTKHTLLRFRLENGK